MSGPTFPPIEPGTQGDAFAVVGFNKSGKAVPLSDPAIVTTDDAAIATASVNPDGTGGLVNGIADGSTLLNASSGALVAEPATIAVATDNVVVSIAIVPKS